MSARVVSDLYANIHSRGLRARSALRRPAADIIPRRSSALERTHTMGGVAIPELKQCVLSSRALARSRVLSRARRRIVATSNAADFSQSNAFFTRLDAPTRAACATLTADAPVTHANQVYGQEAALAAEWEPERRRDAARVRSILKRRARRRDERYDEREDADGDDCRARELGGEHGGAGTHRAGGAKARGLSAGCLEL